MNSSKPIVNQERRLRFLLWLNRVIPVIDYRLRVAGYRVETEKVQEPLRLVLITDLHGCRYGQEQQELLTAIRQARPDLILLGGDLFDDRMDLHNTVSLLSGIGEEYPCFCVTGNHEYYGCDGSGYLKILREKNIHVLENSSADICIRGQSIRICGVSDMWRYKAMNHPGEIYLEKVRSVCNPLPEGIFTILLAHRPEFAEDYGKTGVDLILCGHAHGGQWRIPGRLNGFFAPGQGFFPRYAGGEYALNGGHMIISRGLSRERTLMPRIWNPPELVVVDIAPGLSDSRK